MKKLASMFCSLAPVAANCCAMAAVFSVLSIVEDMENTDPGLAVWLICLSVCFGCVELFFLNSRDERSIIVCCGFFFVIQRIFVFCFYGIFSNLLGIFASIAMWLYSYYACYMFSIEKVTPEKMAKSFDICSLILVFLLFFCLVKKLSLMLALPLAVSMLVCLLALALIRSGEQRRSRSILLSASMIIIFGLVSYGFVLLASGSIRKVLEFFRSAVLAVLKFILGLIDMLFCLLAKLIPEKQYESVEIPVQESFDVAALQDMSYKLIDAETLLVIIIGVGFLIAAAMIIYRLAKGGRHIRGTGAADETRVKRSRSRVSAIVGRLFSQIWHSLHLRVMALIHRNTAQGLFYEIERKANAKQCGRHKSESCREFLTRVVQSYPWAQAELMILADAMDEISFGSGVLPEIEDIIKIRKKIFGSREKNSAEQ